MDDSRKRNMERRRETSRFAARDRRGKEADIFGDLRDVVPIVEEGTVTHLDRIALLRVAATVCRLRKTASNVLENNLEMERDGGEVWNEDMISECLDGFVLIADSDSTILYITESVSFYLGLSQTDLTGRTLKEFLHPGDYDELVKISTCPAEGKNAVFRMKTVISPRGRCLNLKSALYKPVSFLIHSKVSAGGHVFLMQGVTIPAGQGTINTNASALNKYSDTPSGAFTTRHTCDMRISFVSDRFNYILRSELKSLMGTSYYDLVHPADVAIVAASMKELFEKGHTRTPYYRLIAANNSLAWVQTEATTISHTTKGQKGQYVICVHFVLGMQGAEESLIVSTDAMPAGVQVDIKKEIDDTRDYIGRQPEIVECVDFTPLIGDTDTFDLMPCEATSRVASDVATAKQDMGARKNSYDDVLQWLFRDQPSSPAPHRSDATTTTAPPPQHQQQSSQSNDPSLASAQFVDSTTHTGARSHGRYDNFASTSASAASSSSSASSSSAASYSGGAHYSPLADGFSQQCGLDSSPTGVATQRCAYRNVGRVVGGADDAHHTSRRFSAVPPSNCVDVSAVGMGRSAAAMYTAMSAANVDGAERASQSEANATVAGVDATATNNCSTLNYQDIICDDIPFEAPDLSDLSGYAPYVDTCDMLTIGDAQSSAPFLQTDDYLNALYDLPDFTPAQPLMPAARPVAVESLSPPAKRQQPDYQGMTFSQFDQFWYQQQQQQQQNI